ncbi:hypothetical protein C3L23_08590 [Nautilia sp. PV-1]|uniref:P-loop NTPase fold protein n=1 Tax=Nautilia sp. PV-1 TaxID=2579250 RepID=UPI000FDAA105|nr:P-loop NTPase fold protein [Nautilia sp. PV-1]AZV47327.1 hypothetical protein C3L23_08590 [Nautilia sp. PV-1]
MKISQLEEKLYEIFIKDNFPVVIAINGEWGSGKTYFWQNIFLERYKNKLKDKKIAYVSLFGHNSLNDIKTDIILQISKTTKIISKIQDKVKNIKGMVFKEQDINISLGGGILSAGLSLLTVNDFKNVIICFDDFERLSSNIKIKDLMGFISNLKEQKNCKILMILNEEELKKIHKIQNTEKELDTFSLYKEKIVDYEFLFKNDIKDFIENHIDTKFNKNIILDYFYDYQINNLRLIKQLIEKANFYKDIISNITEKIQKDFIYLLFSILYLKKKYNLTSQEYYELKKIQDNIRIKNFMNSAGNDSNEEDTILTDIQKEQIEYLVDFANEDIENLIWQQLENERDIRNELKEDLEKLSLENQINQDKDKIMNNWNRLHLDFSYTIEDFIKDIKPILEKENVSEILSLSEYHFFVNFVEKYDKFDSEKIEKTIKKYIDKIVNQEKSISIHEESNIDLIRKHYPDLLNYVYDKKLETLIQNTTCKGLKELLEKVINGWGEKDQYILNNISKSKYKECIISNPAFVEVIIRFLKAKKRDDIYFRSAIKNILKVLEELEEENESYKFKVEKIFNVIGIQERIKKD